MFSVTITQSTIKLVNFCVYTVFWKKTLPLLFLQCLWFMLTDFFTTHGGFGNVICGMLAFCVKECSHRQSRTLKWEALRGSCAPLRRGMADSLKNKCPLYVCYHVKFSSSASKGVRLHRWKPQKLGNAGTLSTYADALELRSSRRLLGLSDRIWAFCVKRYERY